MPTPAPVDNLMAVAGLPVAFALTSLGIGLFVERTLRAKVPNALLIPLGASGAIIASLAVYWTGLGVVPAVIVMLALSVGGAILAARDERGLRSRLNPGWPGAAALAAYLLFVAPELVSGHWTWSGYNLLNDTATQWLLASYMKAHGTVQVGLVPAHTTGSQFVQTYLATSYPLGGQAHLATLSGLLDVGPDVVYQGYLSALAATTAMSLGTLADGFLDRRLASLAGFLGVSAYLTYQYTLQGTVKELATLATSAAALAIAKHVVRAGITLRGAMLTGVPLAALLDSYNAAAVPFAGAIVLVVLAALAWTFFSQRRLPGRPTVAATLAGSCVMVVLAAPAISAMENSFKVTSTAFVSGGAAPELGQLARPLPLSEVSGVWLDGDYRYPVPPGTAADLTALMTVLIFGLAVAGAAFAFRERELGPLMLLISMWLVIAGVVPAVSPYAAAKVLAVASPACVFAACVGVAGLYRTGRRSAGLRGVAIGAIGMLSGAALGVSVIGSDALAYHHDNVAPMSRMLSIEQVAAHYAGRGPVLWNEFEEYAKYFARRARVIVPFETLTPKQAELLEPANLYGRYFDLDREKLSFVESFPIIVMRHSPSASRPPANYELRYSNAYYEAWERRPRPVVLRHLGLQGTYAAAEPVACASVAHLVSGAPGSSQLVAAVHPYVGAIDPRFATRPAGWPIDGSHPEAVTTATPGYLTGVVRAPRHDRYEVWAQGDFQRPMEVEVDGHATGRIEGVNTPHQWLSAGWVELTEGTHTLRIVRGGGSLAPGNGADGYLGPIAIEASGPDRLATIPVARWRSLCDRRLDWVELEPR